MGKVLGGFMTGLIHRKSLLRVYVKVTKDQIASVLVANIRQEREDNEEDFVARDSLGYSSVPMFRSFDNERSDDDARLAFQFW